ncbi:MAG: YdcF family protein [Methyloceanibacter sp.]
MTEPETEELEQENRLRRFSGFAGGLRLIFDGVLLIVVLLIIGFVIFADTVERKAQVPAAAADGIAVLTGGVSRIDQAMQLLEQGKAKRVLITGVYRGTTEKELQRLASAGDQYFACCVDIDKDAYNTIGNAAETSEWVALHGYNSLIVVTSNYHMPRALAELARVMPTVDLIPYAVVDNNLQLERWWTYPGTTRVLLTEYLKYLPALGRLGATKMVRAVFSGEMIAPEDLPQP